MTSQTYPPVYPATGTGNNIEMLPEPMTVYEQTEGRHGIYENYIGNQSFGGGIAQIFIGILCIICNCTAIAFNDDFSYISYGIWCGSVFVLSGLFGTVAANKRNRCWILTFLTSCIISIQLTFVLLIFCAIDIKHGARFTDCHDCPSQKVVTLAMQCCLLVFAVFETAFATWGMVICFKAIGCCCICPIRKTSNDRINLIPGYRHVGLFASQQLQQTQPDQNLGNESWTRITSEGSAIHAVLPQTTIVAQSTANQNILPEHLPPPYTNDNQDLVLKID